MAFELILLRHGESQWNLENRFTGWADVPLTANGIQEAIDAAKVLSEKKYQFDFLYTSVLKRAIQTAHLVLDEMNLHWIPEVKDWRLNERHYGALQGLNKSETAQKYGEDQVKIWRRSYDVLPPLVDERDPHFPGNDQRYASVSRNQLPRAESLKETVARVVPFFNDEIVPRLRTGQKILIVAHGNSIRGLLKHLENISNEQILELNIPTAIPISLRLDQNMKFLSRGFIGDPDKISARIHAVANQGKSK